MERWPFAVSTRLGGSGCSATHTRTPTSPCRVLQEKHAHCFGTLCATNSSLWFLRNAQEATNSTGGSEAWNVAANAGNPARKENIIIVRLLFHPQTTTQGNRTQTMDGNSNSPDCSKNVKNRQTENEIPTHRTKAFFDNSCSSCFSLKIIKCILYVFDNDLVTKCRSVFVRDSKSCTNRCMISCSGSIHEN